jgi:hypothetical protein
MSGAHRAERTVTFRGPGARGEGVPLVADLRSVELSDHPLLMSLRDATGRVARAALLEAKRLGSVLPEEISARPASDLPSLWECFQHEFARYSLAPALMNLEIARAALAGESGPVELTERGKWSWWLGGSGAAEAISGALWQLGRSSPPRESNWDRRRHLLPWFARHAPRSLNGGGSYRPLACEGLPAEPGDVLFLGVAATTAPIIAHLTGRLEAEGLRCAALDLHYEGSTAALRRTGVRVIDGDPRRQGGLRAERALRRHFGPLRRQALAGIAERVQAGALPRWLEPVVDRRFTVALGRDLPAMAAYREAARRLLDATRPQLVVGFHLSPDFLAPLLLAAQLRGVPTVCLQHGIRGPVHRNGVALPWDLLPVWGQYTVDLYEGLVEERSRWVVTGNCMYDGEVVSGEWGVQRGRESAPVVLAATQSDEGQVQAAQARWWLRGVAEACAGLGARLVIRPHPAETALGRYEELAAAFPGTLRLAREGTWPEALAGAGALVTRDSTVVYQAALAGKPALTVALAPYRPRFPLAQHGGALGVQTYEEIRPALEDALSGGPRTQELARRRAGFLEYHLGPQDGKATERVLEVLREALSLGARASSPPRKPDL